MAQISAVKPPDQQFVCTILAPRAVCVCVLKLADVAVPCAGQSVMFVVEQETHRLAKRASKDKLAKRASQDEANFPSGTNRDEHSAIASSVGVTGASLVTRDDRPQAIPVDHSSSCCVIS
jgi:hypothetical protein